MKRVRVFLFNALILTATSLLISSVGVWFSLYLSEAIGAEAMGIFQLIMSVYTFATTLAVSGISLAAMRLVAEEMGKSAAPRMGRIMARCLCYSLCFGTVTALALWYGAETIGLVWLGSDQTILSLRAMALSMPFLAMSAALGGYFTAVRRVGKNSTVQILEQFLKILLTIAGLGLFGRRGLQYACLAIIGAGTLAQLLAFLCSLALYLRDLRSYRRSEQSGRGITHKMFSIALPIALSSYLRSGLVTLKNLLVPVQLKKYGVSSGESFAAFGTIHGIALPVVLYPSAFLSAFANLIVPELAECRARNDDLVHNHRIHYMVGRMMQSTLLFSIGVAGVLFFFSGEIGAAVCQNPTVEFYIKILAPIVPVMYLDTIVDSMLKGLNEQVSSMRYNIIDALVSIGLVWTLLPRFGIKGYIVVILVSEILNFILSIHRLLRVTQFRGNYIAMVLKPILCVVLAALLARLCGVLWPLAASALWQTVAVVILTVLLYLFFLLLIGCFTREDLRWFRSIFQK